MKRLLTTVFTLALCAGAEMKKDVEYRRVGGEVLTLDASIPNSPGPHPAVIIVHGGGFINGTKQSYVPPLFDPLTKGNFAWFTINYRLAPKYKYPAAVEDVQECVRWVKEHAREYKVDPNRLVLMGESAGGYLVSQAGVINEPKVAAVVSFYGVHDFISVTIQRAHWSESSQAFFGIRSVTADSAPALVDASPYHRVRPGLPPFLLIHGTVDKQVPYEQSVQMCEKLRSAGGVCDLFTVPGGEHGVGAWEKHPDHQLYKDFMVSWLTKTLRH